MHMKTPPDSATKAECHAPALTWLRVGIGARVRVRVRVCARVCVRVCVGIGVRARAFACAHLHNDRAAQPRHQPGEQRALSPAQTEPEPQPARAAGAARPHATLR